MKPAPFAYVKFAALDQVFDPLAGHFDEACLLAGGQSLILSLNLCLSAPAVLIDLNELDELAGIASTTVLSASARARAALASSGGHQRRDRRVVDPWARSARWTSAARGRPAA